MLSASVFAAQLIEGTHHVDLQAKLPTGAAAGVFLRALLLTACYTGFRRGDLFSLRKTDLRRDGVVTIIQSKTGQPLTRAVRPETMTALRAADVPGELLLPWRARRMQNSLHRPGDQRSPGRDQGIYRPLIGAACFARHSAQHWRNINRAILRSIAIRLRLGVNS